MVFLVPFDGSSCAHAALDRAVTYGAAVDRDVVAVSYVPTGDDYAERRRWVDPSEDFATDTVASDLRRKIEEATDDAEVNFENSRASPPGGGPSDEVRHPAVHADAPVVCGATADDGQVVVPIDGDGDEFDVHVVRRA